MSVLAFILKFIVEILTNVFATLSTTPKVTGVHDAKGAISQDDMPSVTADDILSKYDSLLNRPERTDSIRRPRS